MPTRLILASAFGFGIFGAFWIPAIPLILVQVFGASASQVGIILMINGIASVIVGTAIPVLSDRYRNYLMPMVVAIVGGLALTIALSLATSLIQAVASIIIFGSPAGSGFVGLFALLRHVGISSSRMMQARAAISFSWVAGPPLATLVMSQFGTRSAIALLGIVTVFNVFLVLWLRRYANRTTTSQKLPDTSVPEAQSQSSWRDIPWRVVALFGVTIALLQSTNTAAVANMGLFVSEDLRAPLFFAGIALGLAALLEIPALLGIGKVDTRYSYRTILLVGCVFGVAYYTTMALAPNVWVVLAAQLLNAVFYACVAGLAMTIFQTIIDRPGLSTALYSNAMRIGGVLSGMIITIGVATPYGYAGVYLVAAVIVLLAIPMTAISLSGLRTPQRAEPTT